MPRAALSKARNRGTSGEPLGDRRRIEYELGCEIFGVCPDSWDMPYAEDVIPRRLGSGAPRGDEELSE